MLDSLLLWCGGAALGAGVIVTPWRRLRRRGAIVAASGAILIVVALSLPVRECRATARATMLDEWMPVWQFDEHHEIHVDAPPDRVYAAIRGVRASEIALFKTLTSIRRGFRKTDENILNASDTKPLLEVATSTSFIWLTDAPPREVVVGTSIVGRLEGPADFHNVPPGRAVAAMNFVVTPDGRGGSKVSTETRVYANGANPLRVFKIYWRIIHPGSDIIRRMWLRAIKRRAEA
jgi:hypothetical protein